MPLERIEHRARQYICAYGRVADGNYGDVWFGEAQRQRGGCRHARQHTAERADGAGLMTARRIFAISRRMEDESRSSCPTCGSWWRLPVLLAIVIAGIF